MGLRLEKSTSSSSRADLFREMYLSMLLTRLVDEYAWEAYQQGRLGFVASCRGHEAAQVGSAVCIQVGQDFTLPYYRDLGVVLTIGMTPYEVFRTYLQTRLDPAAQGADREGERAQASRLVSHWGYHKHNLVSGPAPVATQIMHAAGIAFACKLRKSSAVTVAYCGDGAAAEADFREGISFAAHHQLAALFICEQNCSDPQTSALSALALPAGLHHVCIDGGDVMQVYTATQQAMQRARSGQGPTLLELCVVRTGDAEDDPLQRCARMLQGEGNWDETRARELEARLRREVAQALTDVLEGAC